MSDEKATKQPVINVRGAKVALGPMLAAQREIFVAYMQDPEISIYAGGSFKAQSLEQTGQMFDDFLKKSHNFSIYELENLTMIGTGGLREVSHRNGTASFGIEIGHKDYWGKGFGTEATRLVLDYGFRFLNLSSIYLNTFSFNARAVRSYEKAGFKHAGQRRGAVLLNGQRYDDLTMDCLSSEFESPVPVWFTL